MKNNKKILAAILAAIVVLACVVVVAVNNNETTSTMNNSSSMSEISSDVNSNESKDESSESIIIGTAPDDEGNKDSGNGNVIDFPSDDDKSSSSEDVANSTSKEDASTSKEETSESKTESSTSKEETSSSKEESTTKPENSTSKEETSTSKEETSTSKEETSSSSESVTTPEENSSSSEVIVPPVEDDPTPSNPGWSGDYDNLPSDGFDHIKVPTIDDFYDEGLSNNDGAFDFGNRPEWEDAWYDAYDEFLVANGSPIDPDTGKPMGAFNAIHDGFTQGYQYLYYGFSQGATNGWGDVVLCPNGLYPWESAKTQKQEDYKDAYFIELSNFTFGNMDEGLENEYRSALVMMLSWVCPNPSQVENTIYNAFVDDNTYDVFEWYQVGEVDWCLFGVSSSKEIYTFAIRPHL